MAHTPGQSTRNRRLAAAVVLAVLAIFAGISLLPDATGFLPLLLGRLQRAAAGRAAPVLPALLVAAAALIARPVRLAERLGGAAALLVVAAVVLQTRVSQADVEAGLDPRPGGALGAAATWALSRLAGEIGLWVLLGLLGAAGVLLVLGPATAPTVRAFWQGLTLTGRGAAWVGRLAARAGAAVSRVARVAGAAAGVWAARWWVSAREWRDRRRAEALARAETARASTAADPAAAVQVIPAPVSADETRAGGPEAAAPSTLAGAGPAAQDAAPQPAPPTRPRRASRARETSESGAVASSTPAASATPAEERPIQYKLPPTDLLTDASAARGRARHDPEEVIRGLEKTLQSFGVEAKVVGYQQGPVVTRYEVQPAAGVKVQRITSLQNDIALNLAAQSIRIEAPIPGRSVVGIEIPNERAALVPIREILESELWKKSASPLAVAVGKDIAGTAVVADLLAMPHLLIAGATGSGKSVLLNVLIASLLFRCTPHQVRLLLIDPKRVELTNFNGIPHLLTPVVTSPREAAGKLKWAIGEMEARFSRFAEVGVRNIQAYNRLENVEPLPYIIILVDELADLMMVAPADFEDVICRLAQMTRATGIHLVVATQRPSVDVITGLIKANIPSRIAFAVSSQVDSRTILDMPGAEKLLGRGDMLYLPIGASRPQRIQGSLVTDQEIEKVAEWWRAQGQPMYDPELLEATARESGEEGGADELMEEAARIVVRAGYGSVSLLQRKMRIGYVRAARVVDQLEERGIVGPPQGSNPREVLVGIEELERILGSGRKAARSVSD